MISRPFILGILTTAVVSSMIPASPTRSETFSEQEIEQSNVIAVAEPLGETGYNLLIIEQIPGGQQCWRESGEKPTTVEPLLLNFDFTKSCRRSTDSNGYSIRIDGKDYGLDYLLRIVERNGELQLVGTPRSDRQQQEKEVIVGRTYGVSDGFLKIVLNSGWQFSKRTYQGKTLGHVYLAGSSSAINSATASDTDSQTSLNGSSGSLDFSFTPESSNPASSTDVQANSAQVESDGIAINVPPPETSVPSASSVDNDATGSQPPPPDDAQGSMSSSDTLPPPPVPQAIQAPTALVSATNSDALTPSAAEGVAIAVPSPSSDLPLPSAAEPDTPAGSRRTLSDVLVVAPQNPGSSAGSERLPVPQQPIPSAEPSPVSQLTDAQNYKVMVEAVDASQTAKVRSLYPDAFSAVYEGRSLLQIGVFSSRDNADKALQSLENQGLTGVLVPF